MYINKSTSEWVATVTVKVGEDKARKLEITASRAKFLLKVINKIPEEIIEVHIFKQGV